MTNPRQLGVTYILFRVYYAMNKHFTTTPRKANDLAGVRERASTTVVVVFSCPCLNQVFYTTAERENNTTCDQVGPREHQFTSSIVREHVFPWTLRPQDFSFFLPTPQIFHSTMFFICLPLDFNQCDTQRPWLNVHHFLFGKSKSSLICIHPRLSIVRLRHHSKRQMHPTSLTNKALLFHRTFIHASPS